MKTKLYKAFNESFTQFKLFDRLNVFIILKPSFHKTYVTLSTPIGSINRAYKDELGKVIPVPAGIAHFLEHKVFEVDGEDISRLFALEEAQINAYTEHNRTTYLFSATDKIIENTSRLINMFFNPKFTASGIEKEKNIIKEELNMHLDDPYHIQYYKLLQNMFLNHPIKDDILGDNTSIDAIDIKALKAMHKAYYQPEESLLIMIGDLDVNALKNQLEKAITLPKKTLYKPSDITEKEPKTVVKDKEVLKLDVLMPSVLIGIKRMPSSTNKTKYFKDNLSFSIYMDLVYGRSSDFYELWMNEKLVNDSYGLDLSLESSYGYALIGSETSDPERLYEKIVNSLIEHDKISIHKEDFERIKKQMIGSFVMGLDSLEYLAHETSRLAHEDMIIYDVLDIAKAITYEEVIAHKSTMHKECLTGIIVLPK
ncbi:MAG: EF-P 5-aminopentanol modification-associated protein YfmH [Candidatus Izemoplasmataceae bacterium]